MSIGTRLKALRKGMGLTQQKLAEAVGVSRIYIQSLESGRRNPSMKLLNRLAETLQASITDIVDDITSRMPRMQLEDLLMSGQVDVWFRSRKLSDSDKLKVERVIRAVLDDWDENDRPRRPYNRKTDKR